PFAGPGHLTGEYFLSDGFNAAGDLGCIAFNVPFLLRKAVIERHMRNAPLLVTPAQRIQLMAAACAPPPINPILITQASVDVLGLMAGFGPPLDGRGLHDGSRQFGACAGWLKSAHPDDSWQGAGAYGYADLDTVLHNATQALVELEAQLAT